MKLSKEEVYQYLSDKKWHTRTELAEVFAVHFSTVSNRVTELMRDGVSILIGNEGYRLTKAEDITDEDIAISVEHMVRWMVGTVARQAVSGKPIKRLLSSARKLLPKTKEEKIAIRKYLVQLTHLIDWDEADEEE